MFIDNSNVFFGQLAAGWRIDAKKLHSFILRRHSAVGFHKPLNPQLFLTIQSPDCAIG